MAQGSTGDPKPSPESIPDPAPSHAADPAAFTHAPVLLTEVLTHLNPQPGHRFLDCTLGLGGHAAAIAEKLGPTGRLVGVDLDPAARAQAEFRLRSLPNPPAIQIVAARFDQLAAVLQDRTAPPFDCLLADFGVSSMQFDDPARGFSFRHDAPLDMRMDPTGATLSAADWLQTTDEAELARIFYEYGEERKSRQIAAAIVRDRRRSPIRTTFQLAELCTRVLKGGSGDRIHPATRVFQALRIAVNGELEAIDGLLDSLPTLLAPGGRAAFISFHSLEDRRVKEKLKFWRQSGRCRIETPKPVQASPSEVYRNPRARSAKLRVLTDWQAPK